MKFSCAKPAYCFMSALQQNAQKKESQTMIAPYRSVLYIPGSKPRVLEKALTLDVDALIFDLEDAVAPDEKPQARAIVKDFIQNQDYGQRKTLIRINGLDTIWGAEDLAMAVESEPHGILLPKVETAEQVLQIAHAIGQKNIKIWAMMETPLAVFHALEIAQSHKLLEGFVLGTNDLAKDLRAEHIAGREPLLMAISTILCAARTRNIICVDGVYNAFKDEAGLIAEAEQGRRLGMDGKTLIHPLQIEPTNRIFAPDAAAVDLAKRQVEAYAEALKQGQAVAVVDGKIVENLHVETAKRLIALDEAIQMRSQS